MSTKSVVVVGGGFSGTITAVNLARLSPAPLHISVVNKSADSCRGVAYSTRNPSHLLNVVARNMSALADQPNHFVEWLATRSEFMDEPMAALRERFAPRRVYGDYLQSLFLWYSNILAAEKKTRLEYLHGEVNDIVVEADGASVALGSGAALKADKVILAAGNQAPAPFRLRGLNAQSPRYIGNPWIGWEKLLPSKEHDLMLIGTGLTMVDAVLTLHDVGWKGKIIAVSRNGLLPLSHFKGFDYPDLLNDESAAVPLRKMLAIFKKHYRAAVAKNLNPAILVDKLRPFTQRLWQNFSLFEKRQFNRHFRTRWNVVRHRIAPEIHSQIHDAIVGGRLEVVKGRLSDCAESADGFAITVNSSGKGRPFKVGALINCTGPQENYVAAEGGLFQKLSSRGLIQPDDMNMGLRVASNFAVFDAKGNASEILFAMGSLLKGTLWETTAVPELRSQAFRLAETVAAQLAEDLQEKSSISEVTEEVIEYFI